MHLLMNTRTELSPSAQRIAQVAQALVQEVGYKGFSFEHISKAVGMRKASIHHHFASKADLGVAVVKIYTRQFEDALQTIEAASTTAPQRLRAYAGLFETTYLNKQNLCVCGMLGAESNSLDEAVKLEVQRFFQLNLDWLTEMIAQGLASGTLHSTWQAPVLAETLLSMLEGAMLVGRSLSKPLGPGQAGEVFISSWVN
jgi:TetR/AcrR family transcriptional repressor of nem operon